MAAPVVLYSRYHAGVVEAIGELNRKAIVVEQEKGEYRIGQHRPQMYERIAARIVSIAAKHPGTVSLHPGSAVVVDSITQHAVALARQRSMTVRILPGISSVESLLATLGLEIAEGLQVVLAQYLVMHSMRLSPTADAIVLQPGYYDTRWSLGSPIGLPGRYKTLLEALTRSHPGNAVAALVLSGMEPLEATSIVWFRLHQLERIGHAISPLHTLFLPRAGTPKIDAKFARSIDDLDAVLGKLSRAAGSEVVQMRGAHSPASIARMFPPSVAGRSEALGRKWRSTHAARGVAIRSPLNKIASGRS